MPCSRKSTVYTAKDFVVSAGCILFEGPDPLGETSLNVCLVQSQSSGEWLLPKGRKDCNEELPAAAVRETFEETGYHCDLLPVDMVTRAPTSELGDTCTSHLVQDCKEPFTVQVRHNSDNTIKLVYYFVGCSDGSSKQANTQMGHEDFESIFVPAEEAIDKLSYANEAEIVREAVRLVLATKQRRLQKECKTKSG
ncbi:hypothetical protein K7432_014111 [Basidiobolus ranarum]|uniref:Nudix hydrolase domain-containing protein n=1 Tax=Basidiobolus ranarum TaxID=34480 RepID=A0ABR2VPY0_9FUNG